MAKIRVPWVNEYLPDAASWTEEQFKQAAYTTQEKALNELKQDILEGRLDLSSEDDAKYYKIMKARLDKEENQRVSNMNREQKQAYYDQIFHPTEEPSTRIWTKDELAKKVADKIHDLTYLDSMEYRAKNLGFINSLKTKYPTLITPEQAHAKAKEQGVQLPPLKGGNITEGEVLFKINQAKYKQALEQEIAQYSAGQSFDALQNLNFIKAAISGGVGAAELGVTLVAGAALAPIEAAALVGGISKIGRIAKGTAIGNYAREIVKGARLYQRQQRTLRNVNLVTKEASRSIKELASKGSIANDAAAAKTITKSLKAKEVAGEVSKAFTETKKSGTMLKQLGYDMAKLQNGVLLGMNPVTGATVTAMDGVITEIPFATADEIMRYNYGEGLDTGRFMSRVMLAGVGGAGVGLGSNVLVGALRGTGSLTSKAYRSWAGKTMEKALQKEAETGIDNGASSVIAEVGRNIEKPTKISPAEVQRIHCAEFFTAANTDSDTMYARVQKMLDVAKNPEKYSVEDMATVFEEFPDLLGDMSKTPFVFAELRDGATGALTADSTEAEIIQAIDSVSQSLMVARDNIPPSIIIERGKSGYTYTAYMSLESGKLDDIAKVTATNEDDARRILTLVYYYNSLPRENPVREKIAEMITERLTSVRTRLAENAENNVKLQQSFYRKQAIRNLDRIVKMLPAEGDGTLRTSIDRLLEGEDEAALKEAIQTISYLAGYMQKEGMIQAKESTILAIRNAIDPAKKEVKKKYLRGLLAKEIYTDAIDEVESVARVLIKDRGENIALSRKILKLRTKIDKLQDRAATLQRTLNETPPESTTVRNLRSKIAQVLKQQDAYRDEISSLLKPSRETGGWIGESEAAYIDEATRDLAKNGRSFETIRESNLARANYGNALADEKLMLPEGAPDRVVEQAYRAKNQDSDVVRAYDDAVLNDQAEMRRVVSDIGERYGQGYARPAQNQSPVRSVSSGFRMSLDQASSRVDWLDDATREAIDKNIELANGFNVRDNLLDGYVEAVSKRTDEAGYMMQSLSRTEEAVKLAKGSKDLDTFIDIMNQRGLNSAFDDGKTVITSLPADRQAVTEAKFLESEKLREELDIYVNGTDEELTTAGYTEEQKARALIFRKINAQITGTVENSKQLFNNALLAVQKVSKQITRDAWNTRVADVIDKLQGFNKSTVKGDVPGGAITRETRFSTKSGKAYTKVREISDIKQQILAGTILDPKSGKSLRKELERVLVGDFEDYFSDSSIVDRDSVEEALTMGLENFLGNFGTTQEFEDFFEELASGVIGTKSQMAFSALISPLRDTMTEALVDYQRRCVNKAIAIRDTFDHMIMYKGDPKEALFGRVTYSGRNIYGQSDNLENATAIGESRWRTLEVQLQGKGSDKQDAGSFSLKDALNDPENQLGLLQQLYLKLKYTDPDDYERSLSSLQTNQAVNSQNNQILNEVNKHINTLLAKLDGVGASKAQPFSPINFRRLQDAAYIYTPATRHDVDSAIIEPLEAIVNSVSRNPEAKGSIRAGVQEVRTMWQDTKLSPENVAFAMHMLKSLDHNRMFNKKHALPMDLNACAAYMAKEVELEDALKLLGTNREKPEEALADLVEGVSYISKQLLGDAENPGWIRSQMKRSMVHSGSERPTPTYLADLTERMLFRNDKYALECIDLFGYDSLFDAFVKGYERGGAAIKILKDFGGDPVPFMSDIMDNWNSALKSATVSKELYGDAAGGDMALLHKFRSHGQFSKLEKHQMKLILGSVTGLDETEAGFGGRIVRVISNTLASALLAKAGIKSLSDYSNMYNFMVTSGFDMSAPGAVGIGDIGSALGRLVVNNGQLTKAMCLQFYSLADHILHHGTSLSSISQPREFRNQMYLRAAGVDLEASTSGPTLKQALRGDSEAKLSFIENSANKFTDLLVNGVFKVGPLTTNARSNAQIFLSIGIASEHLSGHINDAGFKLLERAGISKQEWGVMAKLCIETLGDYAKRQGTDASSFKDIPMFFNDRLFNCTDEEFVEALKSSEYDVTKMTMADVKRMKINLADKADIMMGSSISEMVTIPSARSRMWNTLMLPAASGTVAGELLRALTKYQSFGVASNQSHWVRTIYKDIDMTDPRQAIMFPLFATVTGCGDPMAATIRGNAAKNALSYLALMSTSAFILAQGLAVMSGDWQAPQATPEYFLKNIVPPLTDSLGFYGVIFNSVLDGMTKPFGSSFSLQAAPALSPVFKFTRAYSSILSKDTPGYDKGRALWSETGLLAGYLTGVDRYPMTAAAWNLGFADFFESNIKGAMAWSNAYEKKKFDEKRLMWLDNYTPSLFGYSTIQQLSQ